MDYELRPVSTKDARSISEIYAPYVSESNISFEEVAPDANEIRNRILKFTPTHPWYVAESSSKDILGYAYACPHRLRAAYKWSAEVSIYLRNDQKRLGMGKELYTTLIENLQERGFMNAFAGITLPNKASVGFHESFGFRKIGVYEKIGFKNKMWHDVGWWQLPLQQVGFLPQNIDK